MPQHRAPAKCHMEVGGEQGSIVMVLLVMVVVTSVQGFIATGQVRRKWG